MRQDDWTRNRRQHRSMRRTQDATLLEAQAAKAAAVQAEVEAKASKEASQRTEQAFAAFVSTTERRFEVVLGGASHLNDSMATRQGNVEMKVARIERAAIWSGTLLATTSASVVTYLITSGVPRWLATILHLNQ